MRQCITDYAEDFVKDKIRSTILWWNVFDDGGYPKVEVTDWIALTHPNSALSVWCRENINRRDYFIAGQAVYFTRDEDAVNFALRWA
jgi:hypothetical protein